MSSFKDNKIEQDPDFIYSPKHGNSLKKMLEANPDGVSDSTICKSLKITEAELENIYKSAIMKLRKALGEEDV